MVSVLEWQLLAVEGFFPIEEKLEEKDYLLKSGK
jgi:hypothetical protein